MNVGKPAWVPVHVCALYDFLPVHASSSAITSLHFAAVQSHNPDALWMAPGLHAGFGCPSWHVHGPRDLVQSELPLGSLGSRLPCGNTYVASKHNRRYSSKGACSHGDFGREFCWFSSPQDNHLGYSWVRTLTSVYT